MPYGSAPVNTIVLDYVPGHQINGHDIQDPPVFKQVEVRHEPCVGVFNLLPVQSYNYRNEDKIYQPPSENPQPTPAHCALRDGGITDMKNPSSHHKTERGLHELYAEDAERADAVVFGRRTDPADRRGFLYGTTHH